MVISYHRNFVKDLDQAPNKVRTKFYERIDIFMLWPFHPMLSNHQLSGKYVGYGSINVTGDWRAVYRLVDDETVQFARLGTHSKLYK